MRRLIAVVCAAAALVVPTSIASADARGPDRTRAIDWRPCAEDPTAECGTLRLPVDWSKPGGPTFDLAIARRPATDPAQRVGTLFVNPGGPGGSGVSYALAASATFSPVVLERFDIIGIDPRGVARSHPVVCSRDALEQPGGGILPRSQPEFNALVAYNRQLTADCRRHTGPLYDHVDSIAVARDIDAVRAALGEERINWFGVSYGTLMGQMYAELFPGRIRSMVNDSNMDHSLGTRDFYISEAKFVEDSFKQWVGWCDRSTNCALNGQNVRSVYADVLTRADAGTLIDPADGHKVSNWELLDTTQFFFSRPRWTQLADWVAALHSGQATAAATRAGEARDDARKPRVVTGKVELVEDVRPHFCQDWRVEIPDQRALDRLWGEGKTAAPAMRTSVVALASMTACIGWLGPINNPQHRLNVSGVPTIMMINGLHDPATGYSWALNVARQLGNDARLLTYEGAGHANYRRNDCTRGTTHTYLIDLVPPAPGATCAASDPAVAGTDAVVDGVLRTATLR
jgi:pimeloyl-ACP methyl ester carboxylesterase